MVSPETYMVKTFMKICVGEGDEDDKKVMDTEGERCLAL